MMRGQLRSARSLLIGGVFLSVLIGGVAFAGHLQPDYHGPNARCINGKYLHWNNGFQTFSTHGFSSSFNARLDDGEHQWDSASGMNYSRDPNSNRDFFFGPIDGDGRILAFTSIRYRCDTRVMSDADMKFDSGEDWYTGTGDAGNGVVGCFPGGCPTDAWSIATHEFGHMSGIGHYYLHDHDSVCQDSSSHHTMCRSNYRGTERDRTIAQYDRAAIQAIYGP